MSGYGFAIAASLAIVVFLVVLLRSRRVREKYAFIWIAVGIAVAVLAAFPELMLGLTSLVGIQTPSNLLFSASLIVLLFVCIQLSVEVSGLEEETRTLAEEVALLRLDVERAAAAAGTPHPGPDASGPGSDTPSR
jgi:hypothetical protein